MAGKSLFERMSELAKTGRPTPLWYGRPRSRKNGAVCALFGRENIALCGLAAVAWRRDMGRVDVSCRDCLEKLERIERLRGEP